MNASKIMEPCPARKKTRSRKTRKNMEARKARKKMRARKARKKNDGTLGT